ncbi:hypothetical protein TPHA_0D02450 [Tetrapisispora phaffii CBS 4417]|uniref:GPI transamidase component GPI17 n=1 Tax=Tetrapisispora phaffii (strain ATCC 24235 / CBS 4417 / NBRC 1672 / NRRL Y-8282 / UCD 70-5) TaxID=1071381 RepID=G8BSR1_TETPH|nr:hypothetical protein TPHA_0D02450 [Tetrapisispora phaffii CBS 4417]CCE62882.1 hypothetical protein TPHA_0D02450 [Tetrapisispora phaffii CBS 4417]
MNNNYKLRLFVLFSYLSVFFLLGVPLWYKLTTIHRADLPITYIKELVDNKLNDVHLKLPIYVDSQINDIKESAILLKDIQSEINDILGKNNAGLDISVNVLDYVKENLDSKNENANQILKIVKGDNNLKMVENRDFFSSTATTVEVNDLSTDYQKSIRELSNIILNNILGVNAKNINTVIASTKDINDGEKTGVSIPYIQDIHLSAILLSGDGDALGWDIESSMSKYITPLREMLSSVYHFTVDSDIVYYNDLNLHSQHAVNESTLAHILDISEISTSDEYSEQIGLTLAIVFPSREVGNNGLEFIKPKSIEKLDGSEKVSNDINWEKYLIPRWGSLIINKYPLKANSYLDEEFLHPIMHKFSIDLLEILGIGSDMMSPYNSLHMFKRSVVLRNLLKSVDTLQSLVRLTESFKQMAVPEQVLADVNTAIGIRYEIINKINHFGTSNGINNNIVWDELVLLSNKLVTVCENAFFDNEMVQQNFFPDEHKTAVYFPFLGPIAMVLFLGIVNMIKDRSHIVDSIK